MNITYSSESDALYVRFSDAPVAETEEVRPGIMLDFDASGRIVAIEVLDASVHLPTGTELTKLTKLVAA